MSIIYIKENTYSHMLRRSLVGMTILLALIANNSALAGMNGYDGNYDDGNLLWSKISNTKYTAQEAEKFCKTKSADSGKKWALPTPEEMKDFYQNVAMSTLSTRSEFDGWEFGLTWLSTKAGNYNENKLDAADLSNGNFNWNGQVPTAQLLVTCVASDVDDTYPQPDSILTWSKIDSKPMNWEAAKNYCANKPKEVNQRPNWRLPTSDELRRFASNVVTSKKVALQRAGWTLDVTWTSDMLSIATGQRPTVDLKTGKEEGALDSNDRYVACVYS